MNSRNNLDNICSDSKRTPKNLSQIHIPSLGRLTSFLLLGFVVLAFMVFPVSAGTKYQSGSPNLSVAISGTNEFTAGETVPVDLKIENKGLNSMKIVQSGIVDRDDIPSTAKMVTVSVNAGDAPVIIKTDPQMIGDVEASQSVPVTFKVLVSDEAQAGTYSLPVTLSYTYLAEAEQQGTDSVSYRYNTKEMTVDVPFTVQSSINLEVSDVTAEHINAGGSGYLTLTLKNTGNEPGSNAVVKLIKDEDSPIVPVESSQYFGDFNPGAEIPAKFKVSVSKEAEAQNYPMKVQVTYENREGENLIYTSNDFGVQVGAKIDFSVTSDAETVHPGEKKVVEIQYRNDGTDTAYSAEARISAVDPFTSSDDLAYLGDLKAGETGTARFEVNTAADAVTKTYGIDSEVRYRDALDNSQISDTVKVPINVVPAEGGIPMMPTAIILVIILGAGYYLYSKRRDNPSV